MLGVAGKVPIKHRGTFLYLGKEIPFHFWSNEVPGASPDTVFFLGTGQIGKIPAWVAKMAPAGIVVVEGLPHWISDPSADDLTTFSNAYLQGAYQTILKQFDVPGMHIVGESQSTPSTIWLANTFPEKIKNVAFIFPMGLNTDSFGKTDRTRFRTLQKRGLRTLLQTEQSFFKDARNLYITAILAKIVISGLRDGSTVNKYTRGISENMVEAFRALVKSQGQQHHELTLFIGAKDKIFPAHEIEQSLAEASISKVDMVMLPNASHSSLATKASAPILEQVVKALRSRD